ncbi:hypothetical protein [Ottowia caeni]|uniref:hypothetical protein n=1 Tax=Ottowia caeni TaxID=2870339 RepID=UPI003D7281CE
MTEVPQVPAVVYPVGRSPQLGFGMLALWLVAAVVVLCWSGDQGLGRNFLEWRLALLLLALAVSGGALWSFWRSQRARKLAFDGSRWLVEGPDVIPDPAEPTQIAIVLDAQRCMLLRWPAVSRKSHQVKWLWADASSDPLRWHLLRCALYSPANRPTGTVSGGTTKI